MILKYYKAAQAAMSLLGKPFTNWNNGGSAHWYDNMPLMATTSFKDVDGASLGGLANGYSTYNSSNCPHAVTSANIVPQHNRGIFWNLTAYASTEASADFDEEDYSVSGADIVGTCTQAYSYTGTDAVYTVNVNNSGASAITINSIKFTKPLYATASSETQSTCLMYVCYLDTPVTINAGKDKTILVNLSFLNA